MDIIYDAMFFLLNAFKAFFDWTHIGGGYGLAIIVLTASLRLALWPLNSAQTRSMKKMQELQPKIKDLQNRHQNDPQKMQKELMALYASMNFNPMMGCLPLLIQLPIFIGLYGMLISPDFLVAAGNERFLFLDNLSHTLTSHAGESLDKHFNIAEQDKFSTERRIHVTFANGNSHDYPIRDANRVLHVEPQPLIPGEPLQIRLDAQFLGTDGFSEEFIQDRVRQAELVLVSNNTKELERLTFVPTRLEPAAAQAGNPSARSWYLTSRVETAKGESRVHWGTLYLLLIYALVTVLYQKVMAKDMPQQEGSQGQVMKLLPYLFVGLLFVIPIPAGVMLYLVVTMLLMFVQTLWVRWADDHKDGNKPRPSTQVIDIKAEGSP